MVESGRKYNKEKNVRPICRNIYVEKKGFIKRHFANSERTR